MQDPALKIEMTSSAPGSPLSGGPLGIKATRCSSAPTVEGRSALHCELRSASLPGGWVFGPITKYLPCLGCADRGRGSGTLGRVSLRVVDVWLAVEMDTIACDGAHDVGQTKSLTMFSRWHHRCCSLTAGYGVH